jgi:hypothetical protein
MSTIDDAILDEYNYTGIPVPAIKRVLNMLGVTEENGNIFLNYKRHGLSEIIHILKPRQIVKIAVGIAIEQEVKMHILSAEIYNDTKAMMAIGREEYDNYLKKYSEKYH